MSILLKGLIGSGIDRVFYVDAEALVGKEVRVAEQDGPVALRIVGLQHSQTTVGLLCPTLSRIEQPQVIPRLVITLVFRVLAGQSCKGLLAQRQVVELVLEDDAGVEQTFLDDIVALGHLFLSKRNLCQVVLAVMRVEGCAVGLFCGNAVACCTCFASTTGFRCRHVGLLQTVAILLAGDAGRIHIHHRSVNALPVVRILTLAPLSLESLLTLADGLRIIEVPLS